LYPTFYFYLQGLGRIALISFILGSILTFHILLFVIATIELRSNGISSSISFLNHISEARIRLLFQWLLYVIGVCIFHLTEFFVTAIYNPSVVDASSFVVDHSKAYTSAMLVATTEFWIKFIMFPLANSYLAVIIGIIFVFSGQTIRFIAMRTCGESFNHIIQHSKKDTHILVTSGIYAYLRHPSYTGFYYWSVGTQLMLGNILSPLAFALASWYFFHRRIPYEEKTLLQLFPNEYPAYMKRTRIGIPFIQSVSVDDIVHKSS
jgi:protein-S-isoprenylcysteine O-methyltransferase